MSPHLLKKVGSLFFELALVIAKQLKERSLGLKKIELATHYIRTISSIHQIYRSTTLLGVGIILLANMVSICQISVILYAPWSLPERIFAAMGLGILIFCIPFYFLLRSFSQDRWMKTFKVGEVLAFALGEEQIDSKKP